MKTHYNFIVCKKYHEKRTIPLYNTIGKYITSNNDSFSLIGHKSIDDIPILELCDSDGYLSAINKSLNGMIYHLNHKTEFDYFFMGDDDTYINFDNLQKFINVIKDRKNIEIFGCTGPICNDGRLHITGGSGWLCNRKTFNVLADHIQKRYITHYKFSDVSIALNVHDYNSINSEKIEFIEVPEFLNPWKPLIDISKIITFHMKDEYTHYDLYHRTN
jgi:hypothetical protein